MEFGSGPLKLVSHGKNPHNFIVEYQLFPNNIYLPPKKNSSLVYQSCLTNSKYFKATLYAIVFYQRYILMQEIDQIPNALPIPSRQNPDKKLKTPVEQTPFQFPIPPTEHNHSKIDRLSQ
jgi:hypothetical protein